MINTSLNGTSIEQITVYNGQLNLSHCTYIMGTLSGLLECLLNSSLTRKYYMDWIKLYIHVLYFGASMNYIIWQCQWRTTGWWVSPCIYSHEISINLIKVVFFHIQTKTGKSTYLFGCRKYKLIQQGSGFCFEGIVS